MEFEKIENQERLRNVMKENLFLLELLRGDASGYEKTISNLMSQNAKLKDEIVEIQSGNVLIVDSPWLIAVVVLLVVFGIFIGINFPLN